MNLELENCGPEINFLDIEKFEANLSIRLPHTYKNFLCLNNGGEPIQCAVDFKENIIASNGDYIASFYELTQDVTYGLEPNMKHHGEKLPKGLIYIANSPAGNFYLLSTREDSYGQIFYKDHEFEDQTPFDPINNQLPESIVKIADDFDEFIAKLYDPDE